MYKNLEILNKINHKNFTVKEVKDFSYAKNLISVPVTINEFFEACKNYPIFFAKDSTNNWFATVMLGYKENKNLFVDDKGNWEKLHYIPAFIRRYPFVFIEQQIENKNELLVALDSGYLVENEDDKQKRLFDDSGDNTEFLNKILDFLNQFNLNSNATTEFIKKLEELDLLEEKVATILNSNQEKFIINGFFIVNEDKLKHLSKKKKEEICNKNLSPLITAHLISLSNIQKLGMKYKQR